ncbi:DUF202 domain-containing protein [Nesterenkonia sp. LB17]|uniref:DUF202 domain-containing protein n=1 Tax=unclassified Nesterenkonia TaxID=2629769 RepID=UPI001F4CA56E|nr:MULTISPECIES: DUF202 domain-containing protein [unclassified Nesterenkonia]MCH8560863.1 DUF202 domain-containing protein [Nesterenkonia sp. DZ6]MCH8563528.1 DUF202 domain-containing protein [Nesterenkonia sp. YGD6]MCH8566178.1 DUF202 domain-containing protein [Nesterenkonia sp. LB17]MCH8570942.1 DUF202 domain-containing protein [Nesterenkonia sp. AY15]
MSPAAPMHADPGLQPERTVLSWGRTMMLFALVGAVFLRWLPHYGFWTVGLTLSCAVVAGAIYLTQRRRYSRQSRGIAAERVEADVPAVLVTTLAVVVLGILGLLAVLA